jgi:sugar lactone lactonase YvrE
MNTITTRSFFWRGLLALTVLLVLPLSLSQAQDGSDEELPDSIRFSAPGIMPEGIEYYAAGGHFLVGSLSEGTIFAVYDEGTVEPFIEDEDLLSTVGIHIDTANERLLVANAEQGVFRNPELDGIAQLASYDLATGERLFLVDLGELVEGRHFANDVTVDEEGTAYVSDSLAPVIYAVTLDGEASVLLQDDALSRPPLGLNGLDYHPDGYLIVSLAGARQFFKVPLAEPADFSEVALEEPVGGDGLIFHPNGKLVVVGIGARLLMLASDDEWASARLVEDVSLAPAAESPTTATIRDGQVYVVFANFGNPAAEDYLIQRVELAAENTQLPAASEEAILDERH